MAQARTGRLRRLLRPQHATPLQPLARGNLVAGLTVVAYAVPQVMAYATVAGLNPIVGLWSCLPAFVAYALLGTSRLLSLGPESSVALMTAAVVAPLAAADPAQYAGLAAGLAIAVAVIGFLASAVRLSFVADLLSRPVMVGYMAGIGVLMIDGQLDDFFGITTSESALHLHLLEVLRALPTVTWVIPLLGLVVIAILIATPRVFPRAPGPLLAVVVAAGAAWLLGRVGLAVPLVGEVPQGLPLPAVPTVPVDQIPVLLIGALGVTLVAFTDTTLTARAFEDRTDPPVRPAAELRAMSVGNVAAGFLQGMPVSSSGSRTALAQASGARSQGYSLVAAVLLVAVLVIAAPALSILPEAGLAALVIYAGASLIDLAEFRSLLRFSRVEFLLAVVCAVGVLVFGILSGILVAVSLSVLAMLARVARPPSAALGFVRGLPGMHDTADFPDVAEVPGLLIFRYDSTLFFANAEDFRATARRLVAEREPDLRWFAVNCEAIVRIDATALHVFEDLVRELQGAGITVCLVRAKQDLQQQLRRAGLIDLLGTEQVYATLPELVASFRHASKA